MEGRGGLEINAEERQQHGRHDDVDKTGGTGFCGKVRERSLGSFGGCGSFPGGLWIWESWSMKVCSRMEVYHPFHQKHDKDAPGFY